MRLAHARPEGDAAEPPGPPAGQGLPRRGGAAAEAALGPGGRVRLALSQPAELRLEQRGLGSDTGADEERVPGGAE